VSDRIDGRIPDFSSCLFAHGLMLHQCAVLCNNLLQIIFNCIKLHHGNQSVEVAATQENT
jgi:hypothetical protein